MKRKRCIKEQIAFALRRFAKAESPRASPPSDRIGLPCPFVHLQRCSRLTGNLLRTIVEHIAGGHLSEVG